MAKYIDADILRKEIEFAWSVYNNPHRVVHGIADAFRQDGRAAMCEDILKKMDSLQQEQQEVDLEKDVEFWFFNDISFKINVEHTMYYYFQECAHRYYELGLKAK